MKFHRHYFIIVMLLAVLWKIAGATVPEGLTIQKDFQPGFGLSIGSVFMIDGKAIVVHDGHPNGYEIFKDMRLYQKDTIYTQNPGRLLLNMLDGTQITVGSQSHLTLNQVSVIPLKNSRKSFIGMQRGKARFNVRKLSKFRQTEFKVKTQTALIGVRGSDFFISADKTKTSVTTFDHTRLEVLGLAQPQLPPTILQDFQRVSIAFSDRPSDIEIISQEEVNRLKTEYQFSSKASVEKDKDIEKDQSESKNSDKSTSDKKSSTEETSENKNADGSTDTTTQSPSDESLNNDASEQETVWMPTQNIIPPSDMIQAQAPDIQDIGTSIETIIEKREDIIDNQIQQFSEEIHEESKVLPSFPGTPPLH
ncbi:MAG: FecR domain-containing protein [Candidatus Magnetomorum sp.]|nr:FecR domain-containing protein [Candidatus Magnetomorum sp.]